MLNEHEYAILLHTISNIKVGCIMKANPLLLQVVSVFFLIYGVVDIIFVNLLLGIILLIVGIAMNVAALYIRMESKKQRRSNTR